jgi:hypothetical protein
VYFSANIISIPFIVNEMQGLATAELVHGNQDIILHIFADRKLVN